LLITIFSIISMQVTPAKSQSQIYYNNTENSHLVPLT